MKYKDYYDILGVPKTADLEQIKKAYRKLARQFHPDVSKEANAEARFKDIGEAYATLKDEEKRAAYDQLGSRAAGEEFSPPPQWNQEFAQGGPGFGEHGFDGQGFGGQGMDGMSEMDLAALFAAMGRQQRRGQGQGQGGARHSMAIPGRDYDVEVRISLEQAYKGTTLNLELGGDDGSRTLEVTVPPGVTDGQKLRLRGKGGKGINGGSDGDIYLHISLAPHATFRIDKHDLYFDLALAPWEAALGAEIEVPTLDGSVLLTVPAGSSTNRKLRLRGRGLAKGKPSKEGAVAERGDLFAVVRIDLPSTLTERERELFQDLSRTSKFNPRTKSAAS